jgi:hypothetical protein
MPKNFYSLFPFPSSLFPGVSPDRRWEEDFGNPRKFRGTY